MKRIVGHSASISKSQQKSIFARSKGGINVIRRRRRRLIIIIGCIDDMSVSFRRLWRINLNKSLLHDSIIDMKGNIDWPLRISHSVDTDKIPHKESRVELSWVEFQSERKSLANIDRKGAINVFCFEDVQYYRFLLQSYNTRQHLLWIVKRTLIIPILYGPWLLREMSSIIWIIIIIRLFLHRGCCGCSKYYNFPPTIWIRFINHRHLLIACTSTLLVAINVVLRRRHPLPFLCSNKK